MKTKSFMKYFKKGGGLEMIKKFMNVFFQYFEVKYFIVHLQPL